MGFGVAPHILHRIGFRRIGRKALGLDSAAGRKDKVADRHAAVNRRLVPGHQYFPRNVPLQMPEELDDLGAFDAPGMDREMEPPGGQAANNRKASS
jgi:hypothetical protein